MGVGARGRNPIASWWPLLLIVALAAVLVAERFLLPAELESFTCQREMMDTLVAITLYAPDEDVAHTAMEAAFARMLEVVAIASIYDPEAEILFPLGLIAGVPAVLIFLAIAASSRQVVTFESNFPRATTVNILAGKPDSEAAERFVHELSRRIRAARSKVIEEFSAGPIADQIRDLLKLKDQGLLTEKEFKAAKARILGLEPWQVE